MKRWLATFSAVLAAGLLVFYFADKRADERAAHQRVISTWEAKAKEFTGDLKTESRAFRWDHPSYNLARMHLDHAPIGAYIDDLKSAVADARRERDSYIKVKAEK